MPTWIERLLLPRLCELSGEIYGVNMGVDWREKRIPVIEGLAEITVRLAEVERVLASKV